MIISQKKVAFINYIDKLEKAYLKSLNNSIYGGFPEIFKELKNDINKTSFVLSNNLFNRVEQVADLINFRIRYPDHYIYEILLNLDGLLLFIVRGYYSTDFNSYSMKLYEFFDLLFIFNEVIQAKIYDIVNWEGSKVYDYLETKGDWFSYERGEFREIFNLVSVDDLQLFQSSDTHRNVRFTIKIIRDYLQIIYRKEDKKHADYLLGLNFHDLVDSFNDKKYKFKLNFKQIFKDSMEKDGYYKTYLSMYYFSNESFYFPISVDALLDNAKRKKSLDKLSPLLDKLIISSDPADKLLLNEEITKRFDERTDMEFFLGKGYLRHLSYNELLQLLKPIIKLLNNKDLKSFKGFKIRKFFIEKLLTGFFQFLLDKDNLKNLSNKELLQLLTPITELLNNIKYINDYSQKFIEKLHKLLTDYFIFWNSEKITILNTMHFDEFYHNFIYYPRIEYARRLRKNEIKIVHLGLKFCRNGIIKLFKSDFIKIPIRGSLRVSVKRKFIKNYNKIIFEGDHFDFNHDYSAIGKYIISSPNKINFYLFDKKKSLSLIICEGLVNKDEINIIRKSEINFLYRFKIGIYNIDLREYKTH